MKSLAIDDHTEHCDSIVVEDTVFVEKEDNSVMDDANSALKECDKVVNPKLVNGPVGKVIEKNYVLNDSSALKKKKSHEKRKEPYNMGTEARAPIWLSK